MTTDMVC